MRIIAGRARGRKLKAPEGLATRPVTDRIKESLFSIWQPYLYGAAFLDLFSGSGSMGLEAMSREAGYTVMVEQAKPVVRIIEENIRSTGLKEVPHAVLALNVLTAIPDLRQKGETFDIIYVDPPFTVDALFEATMEALQDGALVAEAGEVVIRTRTGRPLADRFGVLEKVRLKTYGESQVHFYQCAKDEGNHTESSKEDTE